MSGRGFRSAARVMAALTLWRPWPWAFFHADPPKRVENRPWAPKRSELAPGDWLALHAGARFDLDSVRAIRTVDPGCLEHTLYHPTGVVGVALYRGFYRLTDQQEALPLGVAEIPWTSPLRGLVEEAGSSVWVSGPIVWVFEEVVAFDEPVPCPGERGLWRLPPKVDDAVVAKLRRGR